MGPEALLLRAVSVFRHFHAPSGILRDLFGSYSSLASATQCVFSVETVSGNKQCELGEIVTYL